MLISSESGERSECAEGVGSVAQDTPNSSCRGETRHHAVWAQKPRLNLHLSPHHAMMKTYGGSPRIIK